jgi:hypothetical protein
MNADNDGGDPAEYELRQFERNRYFQGKLMTPRDMQSEQEYHVYRHNTTSRFVHGAGIVRGLGVSVMDARDEELTIELEPGFAIDGYGRPLVVENTTTTRIPVTSNECHLYLAYEPTPRESVPVPGTETQGGEEYAYNRIVDGVEISARETPPKQTKTPHLEMPQATDERTPKAFAAAVDAYHNANRTGSPAHVDPAVYLGSFEQTIAGTWAERTPNQRRFVYDNELLFAALEAHITDDENPHGATGGDSRVPSGLNELQALREDIASLDLAIEAMSDQLSTVKRYMMQKSLKDKVRIFTVVAQSVEDVDGQGSLVAREIADAAQDGMNGGAHTDDSAYRRLVARLLELENELGDVLKDDVTQATLERYVDAVEELNNALDETQPVFQLAVLQDQVCEAADSLRKMYTIIRDE